MSTSTYIYIFGEDEITIWGLTGRERLARMLKPYAHLKFTDDAEKIPVSAQALFLNANFLFDARVLKALLEQDKKVALYNDEGCPAAILTDGSYAPQLLRNLNNNKDHNYKFALLTIPRIGLRDLKIDVQQNLKKKDPPYILPVSLENKPLLEKELFSGSYKGVTDFVTKWVWPLPAYWATHYCVRRGWQPNHVTYASVVFAVLAGVAFWYGLFGTGLLMGWFFHGTINMILRMLLLVGVIAVIVLGVYLWQKSSGSNSSSGVVSDIPEANWRDIDPSGRK